MTYQGYGILGIILLALCGLLLLVTLLIFFKFRIIDVIGDLSGRTAKKQIEQFREGNFNSGKKKYRPSLVNLERGKITEPMSKKLMKSTTDGLQLSYTSPSASLGKSNPSKKLSKGNRKTKDIPTDVLSANTYELPETELLYSAIDEMPQTQLLDEMPQTQLLDEMPQTQLLDEMPQTELLDEMPQTQLLDEMPQTQLLDEMQQTEILNVSAKTENELFSKTEELEQTELLNEYSNTDNLCGTEVLSAESVQFTVIRSIIWIHTDEVI